MNPFIALYGGSFNPPTLAHRAVGMAVLDIVRPDAVWYLVSPQNPHKDSKGMAPFRDRLEMSRLNVDDQPGLVVTNIEKSISERTGSTVTANTLRELKRLYPGTAFAFVMGADNFVKLHDWNEGEYVMDNASIIVMPRKGSTEQVADCPAAQRMHKVEAPEDLRMQKGWILLSQFPEGGISATEVRKQLHEHNSLPPDCIRPDVARYISEQRLEF